MDSRDVRIDELIGETLDECLEILEHQETPEAKTLSEHAERFVEALERNRRLVQAGELQRPSNGNGLGISSALGEWAGKFHRLMGLAYEIDRYYAEECNCPRVGS